MPRLSTRDKEKPFILIGAVIAGISYASSGDKGCGEGNHKGKGKELFFVQNKMAYGE